MLTTTLTILLSAAAAASNPTLVAEIGACDPYGGPRYAWTAVARKEARLRARAACKSQGAAPHVCAWIDASGMRESSWSPSVRHRRGAREDGIGILGLDKRAHRDKWPGDPEPAWCTPEASVLVALDIGRRAVIRWGATDVSGLQAVFAFRTFRDEDGKLHVATNRKANDRLCKAMMARGSSCRRTVTLKDLGHRTPVADRPARAQELVEQWEAREGTGGS